MCAPKPCGCPGSVQHDEHELRLAIRNLGQKYTDLADLVTQYMSQAGDERSLRVANAVDMAELLARIVGGTPTAPNEFPECCLIGRRNANGTERWFCTGVLVHPRVVLTAGHCFDPAAPINVVALNATTVADLGDAEPIDVRRAVPNPRFASTRLHDITVVILQSDARTAPVEMATTAELAAATRTTLVGFGNDDVKSTKGFGLQRKVTVDITQIRRNPGDDLNAAETQFGFESDLEFVAGGGGFDSCNGDSGGPAYIQVPGARKVAGLTSRGIRGTANPCGGGGIYTRVDTQLPFIQDTMRAFGL